MFCGWGLRTVTFTKNFLNTGIKKKCHLIWMVCVGRHHTHCLFMTNVWSLIWKSWWGKIMCYDDDDDEKNDGKWEVKHMIILWMLMIMIVIRGLYYKRRIVHGWIKIKKFPPIILFLHLWPTYVLWSVYGNVNEHSIRIQLIISCG